MKSAIRKTPKEFAFLKLQLRKIASFNTRDEDQKTWVLNSLEKISVFCDEMIKNQNNLDQHSILKNLEAILSIYIDEKIEDKELKRKKQRKQDLLLFPKLSKRQQEIASYKSKLTLTRGPDPLLTSVCELLHLCRWGTKNVPISSSKRTASTLSLESSLQKKELIFHISKLLKNLGLGKRKSIDTLKFSINTAYGHWNAYSIGGFPRSNKPLFSSRVGWNPNS